MKKLLLIVPALAALTLSACGSSGSGTTGTGTSASASASGSTTTPDGRRGGFLNDEVRACLQQQGITIPDRAPGQNGQPPQGARPPGGAYGPPGGGGGFGGQSDADLQKMQDALKKCGVDLGNRPNGGFQRPDVNSAAYQARVKDYVACVRQNGFDLPDPNFSGDGPIFDPKKVDQTDKAFQAASAKCQDELRPQASSSTSPTTTAS